MRCLQRRPRRRAAWGPARYCHGSPLRAASLMLLCSELSLIRLHVQQLYMVCKLRVSMHLALWSESSTPLTRNCRALAHHIAHDLCARCPASTAVRHAHTASPTATALAGTSTLAPSSVVAGAAAGTVDASSSACWLVLWQHPPSLRSLVLRQLSPALRLEALLRLEASLRLDFRSEKLRMDWSASSRLLSHFS